MQYANVLTASRIALELDDLPGTQAWFLVASSTPETAIHDICEGLETLGVTWQRVEAAGAMDIVEAPSGASACIPVGTWSWPVEGYTQLDLHRTDIRERWPVLIWVTTPDGAGRLTRMAPNMASFFLPAAGLWSDGTLSAEEAEAHLAELREHYGMTDDEVIALAERGELAGDADHHAWLILLGRGDLIEDPDAGDR